MAEDTIDAAALVAGLDERPSETVKLRLHGWLKGAAETDGLLSLYGSDGPGVRRVMREEAGWDQPLHPDLPYYTGEVAWGVRREMARTVEDVLARRTRALLLNARASLDAAPKVAAIMAKEFGHGENWVKSQIDAYQETARNYMLT
jgi:glycerol-3-phosphate dehydrogenase